MRFIAPEIDDAINGIATIFVGENDETDHYLPRFCQAGFEGS